MAAVAIFLIYSFTYAKEIEYVAQATEASEALETAPEAPKVVQIITTQEYEKEQHRQSVLAQLRHCESGNNDFAVGDGGASIGSYQWQKETLEHKLGRKMTYDEYYAYVTDYERIHALTYKTYFEDGETWRWKNCTLKINSI